MKRVIAIVIVSLALAAAIWASLKAYAKDKREAGYEAALQKYSTDLKPGLTRKEVESYFRTRSIRFGGIGFGDLPKDALADLVTVGEEPGLCGKGYVHIAFEFRPTEPHELWDSRDSDLLERVYIFHQDHGCM